MYWVAFAVNDSTASHYQRLPWMQGCSSRQTRSARPGCHARCGEVPRDCIRNVITPAISSAYLAPAIHKRGLCLVPYYKRALCYTWYNGV